MKERLFVILGFVIISSRVVWRAINGMRMWACDQRGEG
jgi:hypothetical protein